MQALLGFTRFLRYPSNSGEPRYESEVDGRDGNQAIAADASWICLPLPIVLIRGGFGLTSLYQFVDDPNEIRVLVYHACQIILVQSAILLDNLSLGFVESGHGGCHEKESSN